jgi:hypothetical protein
MNPERIQPPALADCITVLRKRILHGRKQEYMAGQKQLDFSGLLSSKNSGSHMHGRCAAKSPSKSPDLSSSDSPPSSLPGDNTTVLCSLERQSLVKFIHYQNAKLFLHNPCNVLWCAAIIGNLFKSCGWNGQQFSGTTEASCLLWSDTF